MSDCICSFISDQRFPEQEPRMVRGQTNPDCEVHGNKTKGQSA